MLTRRNWAVGALGVVMLGCQSADLRRLETPQGSAVEVRCTTPEACRRELGRLSCPPNTAKTTQPITPQQLVVSCLPAQQARITTTTRGGPLAERGPRRRRYVPTDPFSDLTTRNRAVRVTSTMLSAAERVRAFEQRTAGELERVRQDLAARCRAGSSEHCLAQLDLTPWSVLPEQGPKPARQLEALRERSQTLLGLCQQRLAAACHRLGELVYLMASSQLVPELSGQGSLRTTLKLALGADPQYRAASPILIANVLRALEAGQLPKADAVAQWSAACKQGSPAACLLGASIGWQSTPLGNRAPGTPPEPEDRAATAEQFAERPAAQALRQYCRTEPGVCALSRERELRAGLISQQAYCSDLRGWCSQDDPAACERLASALVNTTCNASGREESVKELYQKACAQGSARSCLSLVQPSLSAGVPMLALAYAVQACQPQLPAGCRLLSEQFGRSRRYADSDTGLEVLALACEHGHQPACHDVHVAEYLRGNAEAARQNLARMCTTGEQLQACRTAAQLDWLSGQPARARARLEPHCQGALRDQESCVELGTLLAQQGDRTAGLALLVRECRAEGAAAATACGRVRMLEDGTLPQTLADIFLDPIASGHPCDAKLLPWYADDDPLRASGLECLP